MPSPPTAEVPRPAGLRSLRLRLHLTLVAACAIVLAAIWASVEISVEGGDPSGRRRVLALASAVAITTAIGLAEWLARRLVGPLDALRATADRLAQGDFSVRVRARRDDELGALGRSIDAMADQLSERLAAVKAHEDRLRVMLDAMEEAVLVIDGDGRIALTNASFARLSGGARGGGETGVGRTAVEALRSAELHDAVRDARGGGTRRTTFEVEVGREARTIAARVAPLPSKAGVIAVLHDVTELRRTDAVRRDFVANASHELRTPLTAIRGFAETLLDGALDEPRIARRFVTNIVENSKRLSRLVDDLLALSRAESPDARIALEEVDPVHVAARVLAALEGKADDKGVEVALDRPAAPIRVRADEGALDQVLMNLVENGIKYTPSGGRVRVRFEAAGADDATIEVVDTGAGIAASHLPRIFERFYRVDAGRTRAQGGTGLGLAIVKHLVQRMEGEVTVESRLGEGSTFRVRLATATRTSGRPSAPPVE